jgi:enoyl-CoA hydratase
MTSFTHVELDIRDRVALLYLDHQPANALNAETFSGLSKALDVIEQDEKLKVVVMSGKGRFFAAGADIKQFTSVQTAAQAQEMADLGQQIFLRIERFSKPIIAAIHGAALGGGLELAMACHIRLAEPAAKLGLPELNLGIIPGYGGTQRLPRIVGDGRALEMALTGDPISGEEAQQYGLVNRCVAGEELLEEAFQLAKQISIKGAVSVAYLLKAISAGKEKNLEEGQRLEAELFGRVFETEDATEGVQAFLEKRKPVFRDR